MTRTSPGRIPTESCGSGGEGPRPGDNRKTIDFRGDRAPIGGQDVCLTDQTRGPRSSSSGLTAWGSGSRGSPLPTIARTQEETISVKLLFGRQIVEETLRLLGQCRSEHVTVMTGKGFSPPIRWATSTSLAGDTARDKGRLVTEVDQANRQEVYRFSRKLEVRHHGDLDRMMSFSISDSSAVTLALTRLDGTDEARAICANSPTLIGGFRSYFEQLWGESAKTSDCPRGPHL